MECNCNNNNSNGGVIPWVRGNRLPLIICVYENVVTQEQVGDSTLTVNEMTRVPYEIQADDTVTVIMKSGFRQVEMPFTTDGNKVMVTDNGELPTGAYTVEVTIERGDGARGRWQETRQVRIYENTSDAQLGEMYSIDADLFFYAKGDTGTGIADITNNPDGTLTITMTDGTSYVTEALKGDKGDKGDTGERGVSIVSFDVTGQTDVSVIYTVTFSDDTTQDISVPKGPQGDTGLTGNGISTTTLNSDYTLTISYTDGTTYTTPSIRGAQGAQGVSVIGFTQTGETATNTMYNLVFSDGRTQSVAIPKGVKGDKGDTGNPGPQGAQGPKGDTVIIGDEQTYTLYGVTGQNSDGAMTQKAVTDALVGESISYDNSTSGLAADNVQGAIDEQEAELTIEDNILSNLYGGNGCINYSANPDAWLVSTKYYGGFIQISRYAGGKLYVKAGSTASAIAFLKETPITAGDMTSNYATGETTVHEISANNDIILSIPSDAVFLYVNMYSNGTDMRPAIIKAKRSVKSSVQNIEEKEKIGVIRQFAINNNNAKMSVCTTACDFELGKSYRITARISPTKTHYVGIYLGNEATAGATAITLMVVGANTNTLSVIYTPTDLSWKYFKNYQDTKGTEFISITVEELSKVEQLELQVDDSYESVTKTTTWTATSGSSSNPSISVDIPANSVIDVNLTGPTNSSYVIGINYEDGTQERNATQYAYDTRFYASKRVVLIWAYTSSNGENFSGTMTAVYSRPSDSSYVLADESYKMGTYRNFESPVFYAEKTITSNVPFYASDDGMAGFYQAAFFTERVDIPIGVYDITRSIPLIKTNQTIQGDGWSYPNDPNGVIPSTRGSLIRLGSDTICGFKFSSNVFNGNVIRDIGFSGTDTNGNTTGYFDASNPSYNAGIVINANRNDQMFIHKVSFRGLAAGISIYDNARIDACTFDGLNTDGCNIGIYFRPTATYFAFLRNSIIADCPACGLYVSKSERSGSDRITFLRVENNVFVRNCGEMTSEQVSALGIKASVVLNTADSCTILNNVFNQSGTHADPTAGTTVTDADTIGLYISGNYNLVTGNYFGTTSGGDTLHVVGSNNLVSNNILVNNATVGGSGTRFINNSFTSNDYTLKVTGSNCHISNNCCTNYIVSGNNNVINAAYYSGASVTVVSGATGNTLIGFESANITNNGSGTVIK